MHLETIFQSNDVDLIGKIASSMTLSQTSEQGLALLCQAREYACQLDEDPWEFAVEIQELKSVGMTVNDLRWLVLGQFAEHACEVAPNSEEQSRRFEHHGRTRFSRQSCFILTPSGHGFAASQLSGEPYRLNVSATKSIAAPAVRPVWDSVRHELTVDGRIVKKFKQHSPNQEAVLTAFQEENWPAGILDPLTPVPNNDSKQRLRDTIKNLNRHQVDARIHFTGDGSGERVLWEVVERA